jgi:hypothetical protein
MTESGTKGADAAAAFGDAFVAGEGEGSPSLSGNSKLKSLMEEMMGIISYIERTEEDLKAATGQLNRLREKQIPDLLAELGVSKLTHEDRIVEIGHVVSGSLPKEPRERQEALDWLQDNDGSDLIKTTVEVVFGKHQHNAALAFADDVRNLGYDLVVESGVHPQSLAAFARERIERGEEVPAQKLGLFVSRVAKIKKAPAKKGKAK